MHKNYMMKFSKACVVSIAQKVSGLPFLVKSDSMHEVMSIEKMTKDLSVSKPYQKHQLNHKSAFDSSEARFQNGTQFKSC